MDIVGAEFAMDSSKPGQLGGGPAASRMAGTMDSSFVLLPKQRPPPSSSLPLRTRGPGHGGWQGSGSDPRASSAGTALSPWRNFGGEIGRGMEDSFVVLPSAASMYRHDGQSSGDGGVNHGSLDTRIVALTRVFELAAQHTSVDHPLCGECTRSLENELAMEVRDTEKDIAAYEACLQRLEAEELRMLSEEEFASQKQQAEAEEQRLVAQLARVQAERAEVRRELKEVDTKAAQLDDLQQRYWHEWNDLRLQLGAHQEERDAVLAKMEVATAQLDSLKSTNVLNDAFHIWHDGEFGTINNFRLGRLPTVPVEWDEINAAWGQACLLLFTMAQMCRFTFSYKILPMGSHPRIADGRASYDLFGPVNLFWSTRYDKAMALFLTCLKEFGEFAHAKDRAADVPPEKCFQLPYKIEVDKVHGLTIKQSFNRDEKWTKALKYTLCDLKWALVWLINNAAPHQPSPPPAQNFPSSQEAVTI